jgi:hypothetical protein
VVSMQRESILLVVVLGVAAMVTYYGVLFTTSHIVTFLLPP